MRDWILAALLGVAAAFIVVGVAHWSSGAAWAAAGVLLVVWSWLVFVVGDAGAARAPQREDVT